MRFLPLCASVFLMTGPALAVDLEKAAHEALGTHRGAVVALALDGKILAAVNPAIAKKSFPAGSVAKLVTAAAAMEDRSIGPDHVLLCRGKDCWRIHGDIGLVRAIAQSCSSYFHTLGSDLGAPTMISHLRRAGFDVPAGKYSSAFAVGEGGLRISPLNLASFAAALANGGSLYRPYREGPSKILGSLGYRSRTREVLAEGMEMAVSEGSARNAALPGLRIAGKTGTAPRLDDPRRTYGWFLGFASSADASKPRLALCVFIEDATGYGEASAVARNVFAAFFDQRK